MIASGEKKEEYREVKRYWVKRFTLPEYHEYHEIQLIHALCHPETFRKDYEAVKFRNGYSKSSPTMLVELLGIHWGYPARIQWCDDTTGKWFFCLELGKIIHRDNDYEPDEEHPDPESIVTPEQQRDRMIEYQKLK